MLLARRLAPSLNRATDILALGTSLGLALFSMVGFVIGWALGLSPATVALSAGVVVAAGFLLGATEGLSGALRSLLQIPRGPLMLALFAIVLTFQISDRVLIETPEGGIATGNRHNYGDLPFHMGVAAGFAYGDNFPPMHPELAGVALTYPFLSDVLSAMLVRSADSWRQAFFWPTFVLGLCVLPALTRFGEAVTGSRPLGRVAAALTLFSGGLGFLRLFEPGGFEAWRAGGPDFTIAETGMKYANFVVTMLVPQRAILFGWPLLFYALSLMVEAQEKSDGAEGAATAARGFTAAGFLLSLLPLVHSHSFLAGALCAAVLAAGAGRASWFALVRGGAPLAVPALLFMAARNSLATSRFFEWAPGFDGGRANPLLFWWNNAGVFLPLAAAGILLIRPARLRRLALTFAALFVAANLFRLSPWIWDNMKFLAPAHAGLAPFAAAALGNLWGRRLGGKALATGFFVAGIASGALDVSRLLDGPQFNLFSADDLTFARAIRDETPPSLTILTGGPHNHPVLLTGRRQYLGYEGHLWSQGFEYAGRKAAVESVFSGVLVPRGAPGDTVTMDAMTFTGAEASRIPEPRRFATLKVLVDAHFRLVRLP